MNHLLVGVDKTVVGTSTPREVLVDANGALVTTSSAAAAPPAATEATLAAILARLIANNTNDDTRNNALIARLQHIIDNRKPFTFTNAVDIRSYAQLEIRTEESGSVRIDVSNVIEGGSGSGIAEVNWGLDNISGVGTSFVYAPEFNGSHTITILGVNGRTFSRLFNHQSIKGINTGSKELLIVSSIYDEVDAQDYLRLSVADAGGMIPVGNFDLQLNPYAPVLPDAGKNKYYLNKPSSDGVFNNQRETVITTGSTFLLPQDRVKSFAIWAPNSGVNYDLTVGSDPSVNYNDAMQHGGFTAQGNRYLNKSISIKNNGAQIVLATLA